MTKLTLSTIAALLLSSSLVGAQTPECPAGVQSCNIAGVFKTNEQQVDSNDNTYAPDSATASASVGDVIAQGGASDASATANGKTTL